MEFDELQLSMKIIEALTAIRDVEGEEMAMSLLHPGAYLNKVYANKYKIDITSISYKTVISEVTMRQICINTATIMCNTLAFPNKYDKNQQCKYVGNNFFMIQKYK